RPTFGGTARLRTTRQACSTWLRTHYSIRIAAIRGFSPFWIGLVFAPVRATCGNVRTGPPLRIRALHGLVANLHYRSMYPTLSRGSPVREPSPPLRALAFCPDPDGERVLRRTNLPRNPPGARDRSRPRVNANPRR